MTRTIHTPIGPLRATTDGKAVTVLEPCTESGDSSEHPLLLQLERELDEYFTCKRHSFTLPLAPQGSPFAQAAWRVLQTIPYGETISYKTEATLMGRPSALRASANANGRNPIMILIPCHRVIAQELKSLRLLASKSRIKQQIEHGIRRVHARRGLRRRRIERVCSSPCGS
ncbi:MAG: methylated-DNA--[protein]-cysteine S-methyltransferase [Campylobacterales bacterium]|nr:methylated-DNA--[protein]-cysteine S-methyltransferase [Campylobacterales bacterium]